MAGFTRVNGTVVPCEQIGRDLVWLKTTADLTANGALEAAVREVAQMATVMIVGTPTAGGCIFGVEGLAAAPAGYTIVTLSGVTFV